MSTSSSAAVRSTVRHPWLAVIAVGLATFSVVTTEMLPVGLLTPIADTLDTSTGTAGLMISLPALLAALFAPLVVIASGGMNRRKILCGLLGLLVIANMASALAPSWGWMLAARVLVGFCMGGIWAIAGGLPARLVPGHAIDLATSIIFGGVAAASVLGVPLGVLIGDFAGWRWAFGGMALLSGLVLAFHLAVIPALPVANSATLRQFGEQLANRKLQVGLMLTLLLMTPMLFLTVGGSNLGGGVALLAWGLAYGGVSVGLMTWMMHCGRCRPTHTSGDRHEHWPGPGFYHRVAKRLGGLLGSGVSQPFAFAARRAPDGCLDGCPAVAENGEFSFVAVLNGRVAKGEGASAGTIIVSVTDGAFR